MSRFEIWYADPLGNRIATIPNISQMSYVIVAGDVGIIRLSTPRHNLIHESKNPDYRIAVYRQPYGAAIRLEVVAFLDVFSYRTSQDGLNQFDLGASDLNHLLKRRIVAYESGNARASFSGNFTSNQMTVVPKENLGTLATDTSRDITSYGFTVNDDISQGAAINKAAAWKNALELLQDMQAFSKQGGSEIFFGIVPTSETTMQFKTWAGQPGSNRTTGTNPIIFSLERGNLLNPQLTYDYQDEANYIYAGGKGQQDQRNVQEAEDTTATGRSPFARKEKFISAISGVLDNSDDQVAAKAKDALENNRARVNLTATIASTPSIEYGRDWFFGDRVIVDYAGFQFDTIIRAVFVSVDGDGRETVQARVELSNE